MRPACMRKAAQELTPPLSINPTSTLTSLHPASFTIVSSPLDHLANHSADPAASFAHQTLFATVMANSDFDPHFCCFSHQEISCFRISMGADAGLTSAMYLRCGEEVPSPDPAAGLYIRTRQHGIVQASIPADHLAFQIGEAAQVSM